MEFISGDFPGHFRTGITLHSRNVLALLELEMYGMAQDNAYRYIPSVETQRIHMSLYFTGIIIDAIVIFGAIRMRTILLSVFRPL